MGDGWDAYSVWADDWGHLTAVIDCHNREIVGHEFALRGRAKEAERVLEAAVWHGLGRCVLMAHPRCFGVIMA